MIQSKTYLGGPPNYGGVVLDTLSNKTKLDFLNIANIAQEDLVKITPLQHKNFIPNFINQTVKFKLIHKSGTRKVEHISEKFTVNKELINQFKLENLIKGNSVIVSPIINEFKKVFFEKIFSLKPETLFLDLFNNDDRKFTEPELKLFQEITKGKNRTTKIFLKLSEHELNGLQEKIVLPSGINYIITKGKEGVEFRHDKNKITLPGIKSKFKKSVGAGDVFLYSFTAFYSKHKNIKYALNRANYFASLSTEYCTLEEMKNAFNRRIKIL